MPLHSEDPWQAFRSSAPASIHDSSQWSAVPIFDRRVAVAGILVVASIMPGLLGDQHIGAPGATEIPVTTAGDPFKQLILAVIYAGFTACLFLRTRLRDLALLGVPLLLLLALCFASSLWSVAPGPTLRRSVGLTGTVVIGLYIGTRFDARGIVRLLLIACAVAVCASWLHALARPQLGFDFQGKLRGLFSHKNDLGSFLGVALIGVALALSAADPPWPRRWIAALGLLCIVSVGASQSATPIGGVAAAFGVLTLLWIGRRSGGLGASIAPALIAAAVAATLLFAADFSMIVADVFGRDPTLSGRTTIWAFLVDKIAERPWFGFGFAVFWLGERSPGGLFWYWRKQFELHSHNGYLELLIDTGMVGGLLFAVSVAILVWRLRAAAKAGEVPLVNFGAALLALMLVINVTETKLWQDNEIVTALYVALYAAAARFHGALRADQKRNSPPTTLAAAT